MAKINNKNLKKITKASADIANENLQKLKTIFPQFVKDGQVDFDALEKFFDEENILSDEEEKYGLNWAGKSNAFKFIRTPATGTLTPNEKESKNFDKTQNLFIEGDNLEVLKLLQKKYRGEIKMIYIDPPYNTGKDFIYKDNFKENVSDYYERTGQSVNGIKLTTNMESNGRYHSDWLTMMYPRLFLAKNLLKNDGVIFISIDDNEVVNLRLIMDEIFGEENFVENLIWLNKEGGGGSDSKFFKKKEEYILVYAKNINNLVVNGIIAKEDDSYSYKDKYVNERGKYKLIKLNSFSIQYSASLDYEIKLPNGIIVKPSENGKKGCWRWSRKKFKWGIKNDFIEFKKNQEGRLWIYTKQYFKVDHNGKEIIRSLPPLSRIEEYSSTSATKDLESLMGKKYFDYSKPYKLIKFISQISTNKNDIILDFFAGSGTTAHAVVDLNAEDGGDRKWICAQLPEETDEKSEAKKAGFDNIAQIARERIRRAGKKINKGDIGFKALTLEKSNYRQWTVLTDEDDEKKFLEQSKLFVEKPLIDKYTEKSVVYEILLKEGFDLNAEVSHSVIPAKAEIQSFKVWSVQDEDKYMLITFAKKLTLEQVESLGLNKDNIFVCLDSALDDSTKINIIRNWVVRVI